MKKSLLSTVTLLVFLSCKTEPDLPDSHIELEKEILLVADFTYEFIGNCSDSVLQVKFQNNSKNATSYLWDFGDKTSSDAKNPIKVYDKAGDYNVSLTASNAEKSASTNKGLAIFRNSDGQGPTIDFSYERDSSNSRRVTFHVKLLNATWYDFDGQKVLITSIDTAFIRPIVYPATGFYIEKVWAGNNDGVICSHLSLDLTH